MPRNDALRPPLVAVAVAAVAIAIGLACTGGTADAPVAPATPLLRPASELVTDCHGWPASDFSKKNYAEVGARLHQGDPAVDFTLADTRGAEVHLAEVLAQKPVLLVQGSWTCPRFQEERLGLEATVKRFRNQLAVLHVYNIEAHPAGNDPSPYSGKPWELRFSDRKQAKTYAERLKSAKDVARDASMPVLVDRLEQPGANPVWCTYGTCASCSWLIRQDGTIVAQHDWHDQASMEASIEALLAQKP